MDVYLNELSLAGQFQSNRDFADALRTIMQCRSLVETGGSRLYSCYHLRNCLVTQETTFTNQVDAIASREQKIDIIRWLGRSDWMTARRHSEDDVFYWGSLDVTNRSVAEASYSIHQGFDSSCFSFQGGGWNKGEVKIEWLPNNSHQQPLTTNNYCTIDQIKEALLERERTRQATPLESWDQLMVWCHEYCANLVVAGYVLDRLRPHPFVQAVAHQVRERLRILDFIAGAIDASGRRTPQGNEVYDLHFIGSRAWFTDESETNKTAFARDLTFVKPDDAQERLFCPWHAKISHFYYRVHFSWPPQPGAPIYVVYIGPKITKS